jgi:hypothetical protein
MRELSIPSLFDSPTAVVHPAVAEAPAREERYLEQLAKDFVRWCFSFGSEFRNSPDVINLRIWCQKFKFKLREGEQAEILVEARRLYVKRIEQLTKKSESSGSLL